MKISLTGKQLRAALHNAAVKDVRYYLNGLYFDIDNKKLVATNGHHMYTSTIYCEKDEHDINDLKSFILPRLKVATTVINAVITYTGYKNIQVKLIYKNGDKTFQCFEAIDSTYPNYERLIPSGVKDVKELYFNASYLALIEKTFGKNTEVKINFYGEGSVIKVTDSDEVDQLVIMPMNRKGFKK